MAQNINKALSLALISVALYPAAAHASWKSPFVWLATGRFTPSAVATNTAATSTASAFSEPSIGELLKRIADLEDKLDKARAENALMAEISQKLVAKQADMSAAAKAQPAAAAPSAASASSSGLSDKELIARIRPAIVSVDTATSSGSGVIIDSKGRILVSAHVILSYDSKGEAVGAAESATITFSNGSAKQAKLVGFNEEHDVALLQLASGSASSYAKVGAASGLSKGDAAYVFASPASRVSGGGTDIVSGTVSVRTAAAIEIVADKKPLDVAAAVIDSKGEIVAFPRGSACKVLEEGKNCLTYKISAEPVSSYTAKIAAGMRLYKDKKVRTDNEYLVRGQLEGTANIINSSGPLQYAISSLSDKNSFDTFNNRLVDDQEGKITKLYLTKLKIGADSLIKAADALKGQSHALDIFFIDNEAAFLTLGDYQRKILGAIESANRLKYKEYEAKVSYWSAKKNEYDTLITNPANATHDYLTLEGAAMETAVKYFVAEKKRIIDSVSAETIGLF